MVFFSKGAGSKFDIGDKNIAGDPNQHIFD